MLNLYKKKAIKLGAFALVLAPVTAVPQSVSETRIVPVSYFGRVAYDGGIDIFQPDGSTARYAGPVPTLPVSPGDVVRFKYEAQVPVGLSGGATQYTGLKAVDGLYDISFHSPNLASGRTAGKGGVSPDAFKKPGGGFKGGAGGNGGTSGSNGVAFNSNTGETKPLGEVQQPVAEPAAEPVAPLAAVTVSQEPAAQKNAPPKPAAAAVTQTKSGAAPEEASKTPENWDTPNPGGPIPVPEPGSMLILAAGTAAIFGRRRLLKRR